MNRRRKNNYRRDRNFYKYEVKGEIVFGVPEFTYRNEEENKKKKAKEEFIEKAFNKTLEFSESFPLLLNKYVPFRKDGEQKIEELKKLYFEKILSIENLPNNFQKFSQILNERNEEIAETLTSQGYENLFEDCLKLKSASRLVVGLGTAHVFETSLTIHHLFGVPYIPSTALKGVVRVADFWRIFQSENKAVKYLEKELYEEDLKEDDREEVIRHKLLFGTQKFKGLLTFLDAYPVINKGARIFELDIMNVHYRGYYSEGKPPGDWENPTPINFLTVRKGTVFCFWVLFDKKRAENLMKGEKIPKKAKEILNDFVNNTQILESFVKDLLKDALSFFGVGAKTRLGYGIFEEV